MLQELQLAFNMLSLVTVWSTSFLLKGEQENKTRFVLPQVQLSDYLNRNGAKFRGDIVHYGTSNGVYQGRLLMRYQT